MKRVSALPTILLVACLAFTGGHAHAETVDVRVEGRGATLYSAQPNVSDEKPRAIPDVALCTLPCTAKLSTETSYVTLGTDGAQSRAFHVSALTRSLDVRQGSDAARTGGLFSLGLGGVAFGSGLGLLITRAVAFAGNNPSTAETSGTLAIPLLIGGAVSLTLGAVLYALSGTHVRDQAGRTLARTDGNSQGPTFSLTE